MNINFKKGKSRIVAGIQLILAATLVYALSGTSVAADKPKRTLKNNMMEVYDILPEEASTFSEMLSKGMIYGRIRSNYFKWNWEDNSGKTPHDPKAYALGGSLIYKLAPLNGFNATFGLYTSKTWVFWTGRMLVTANPVRTFFPVMMF